MRDPVTLRYLAHQTFTHGRFELANDISAKWPESSVTDVLGRYAPRYDGTGAHCDFPTRLLRVSKSIESISSNPGGAHVFCYLFFPPLNNLPHIVVDHELILRFDSDC